MLEPGEKPGWLMEREGSQKYLKPPSGTVHKGKPSARKFWIRALSLIILTAI